jgi:uncharacterized membrane protein YfcA
MFLFFAGALGGAMNAVAGGGSFVAFPALLFTGVAPIPANATNTLSLWVGTAVSGGAYRKRLNLPRRILIPLVAMSLIGGLAGALLLIRTPAHTFLRVIPWLMLGATLLFTFGRHLTDRISAGISHQASNPAIASASLFELLVAIYGGYFGGGIGIMNLAMLAALGMTDIHAMNALKIVLVAVINGVATLTFIATGVIMWPQAIVMILGAACGGYTAAHFAQGLPQRLIRGIVIVLGFGMTVYFFLKAYR